MNQVKFQEGSLTTLPQRMETSRLSSRSQGFNSGITDRQKSAKKRQTKFLSGRLVNLESGHSAITII
jgi:hypothetical protein